MEFYINFKITVVKLNFQTAVNDTNVYLSQNLERQT